MIHIKNGTGKSVPFFCRMQGKRKGRNGNINMVIITILWNKAMEEEFRFRTEENSPG